MRRKFFIRIITVLLSALVLSSLTAVTAQEDEVEVTTYVVREGNTLDQIAAFFNVALDCIAGDNNLLGAEELTVGRELTIASDCPPYEAPAVNGDDEALTEAGGGETEAAAEADPEADTETMEAVEADPMPEGQGGGDATTAQGGGSRPALGADRLYTVVRGDRLAIIARDYGASVRCLVITNRIFNPDLIYVGQTLFIPQDCSIYDQGGGDVIPPGTPPGGNTVILRTQTGFKEYTIQPDGTYIVRPGDILDFIALAFNVDTQCVAAANQLVNPGRLQPGQRLLIDRTCPPWNGPPGPANSFGEAVG